MILDRGSAFLHLLDDIATKHCFRGKALRSWCVAIGISHRALLSHKAGKIFTQKPELTLNNKHLETGLCHLPYAGQKHAAWTLTVKQPNQHDKQCDDFCLVQTKASFLELICRILRIGPPT
jgi:hypothetical protein